MDHRQTELLAYAGASLPLFLLMAGLDIPSGQTLNRAAWTGRSSGGTDWVMGTLHVRDANLQAVAALLTDSTEVVRQIFTILLYAASVTFESDCALGEHTDRYRSIPMFKKLIATGALALFTLTSTVFAASAADVNPPAVPAAQAIVAPSTVSPEEEAALQFMREEEKLAHDVYVAMYAKWGLPIFSNIAASEQQHGEAVATLLDRYDIVDPAAGKAPGEFADARLQALYDQLVAQGSESVAAALKVGAAIEEIDILDLQERLDSTENAAIERVYNSLLAGSENHLRAFVTNLKAQTGETYAPQYLSQAAYDAIIKASGTQGGGNGRWGGRSGGRRP